MTAVTAATALQGCGELVRQSRSPSQLVIVSMLASPGSGGVPATFLGGPLLSDVGNIAAGEAVFDDFGQVTMRAVLRDADASARPSPLNDVTLTQYRVEYRGRPGIDVPRSFDGAVTFTVPLGGAGVGVFELVRHVAKMEPPLAALSTSPVVLTTVADVTFFGRDQAGNSVAVTGSVQINFGNFD